MGGPLGVSVVRVVFPVGLGVWGVRVGFPFLGCNSCSLVRSQGRPVKLGQGLGLGGSGGCWAASRVSLALAGGAAGLVA